MQISVSGKGVDVGEALRSHIESQIDEHVKKYIDRVTHIHAVVSREAHLFRVDITGNLGTHSGIVVRSRGESDDVYAAFDAALEKVSKQLRRYKRKITNHHKFITDADVPTPKLVKGRKYVLPPEAGEQEDEKHSGLVIAETSTDIETMTVSEAVMKMDLQDLPAVMFFNSAHGGLNVVYRRVDGNISWVDPKVKPLKPNNDKNIYMDLATLLPLEAVLSHLPARDKKQVLKLMAARAATLTTIPEREIYSVLIEREHMGCTGMGNGVCIPHGRFSDLKAPLALFARLDHGIEFGAADGKRVDLLFLLLTPASSNTDHLKALATITRLLRDKQLCENLRATDNPQILHDLLLVASRDLD